MMFFVTDPRHPVAIGLLALLLALPVAAQDMPAAAPTPLYAVEILVFRHLDQAGNTPEVSPAAGPVDMPSNQAAQMPLPAAIPTYPALPPEAMQLAATAGQMRRRGGYRPLLHTGWVQPAPTLAGAPAVPLPAEAASAGLRGTLTLFRERYLHLVVDLELAATDSGVAEPARIRQSRRIRGRAWQYFDHPQIGLIVAVRALDTAAPADAEPDAPGNAPTD